MSAVGLVLVFLPVFFLSKRIMRPVAESYEKQKRFITDASHEIKTPLAVISAANEVVELEYGESEWTKSIASQIDRLSDLTQKLVMLSRMDEEDYRPAAETFSLSDTLTEVAETFIPVAQVRQKKYGIRIAPDISFSGDEQAIRQLANLLLDNAMKYAAGEGNIEVSLKKSGKYKVFSVENDVTDMSDGRHDELFERFYRADASRNSETGGHGIGLSVAKAITESHGGKITAECRGGRLTFTCRF
ncbi:MAG: HAMP domain-containing histidine kinase [Clostridia bacterium]|nr:HAMP domain-containing histidine kinase [Clostridia bacterium]